MDNPNICLNPAPRIPGEPKGVSSLVVNGSASGRDDVGADLLQRYGESLSGPDGEERRRNCGEHQRAADRCEDKCFHSNLQVRNRCEEITACMVAEPYA